MAESIYAYRKIRQIQKIFYEYLDQFVASKDEFATKASPANYAVKDEKLVLRDDPVVLRPSNLIKEIATGRTVPTYTNRISRMMINQKGLISDAEFRNLISGGKIKVGDEEFQWMESDW
jgi:hypothetical protein